MAQARRTTVLATLAALLSSCATAEPAARPPARAAEDGSLVAADRLPAMRCLVLAPFENTTDLPEAGEVATEAMIHSIDPELAQVFPLQDLRNLFARTPLALQEGVPPRHALALAEQVGSNGVIYGSVEGRVQGGASDFLVTVRLQSVEGRDLLFARTAPVRMAPGEPAEVVLRRALVQAARPMLDALGTRGERKCFRPDLMERAASLRDAAPRVAAATAPEAGRDAAPACPPAAPCPKPQPCPQAQPCPQPQPCPQTKPRECPACAPCPPAVPAKCPACAKCPPATPPRCPEVAAPAPCPACPPVAAGQGPVKAPAPVPPDPRVREMKAHLRSRSAFLLEDVVFAGRSPVLVIDDGLERLAAAMRAVPNVAVMLEVYVDTTGDARRDFQASHAMAVAVTRRLEALGVPVERVAPAARGGTWPIATNESSRGRAASRRVEVVPLR